MIQKKWVMFIVALVIFGLILLNYQSQKNNTYQQLNTQVKEAKTWNDVKNYQYTVVPGLKRAEQLGLTETLHNTIPIPGSKQSINIHEVWYNKSRVFFLYSIPFDKFNWQQKQLELKHPINTPIVNFRISSPTAKTMRTNTMSLYDGMHKGILYKNRLYRVTEALPLLDDNRVPIKLTKLKLDGIEIVNGYSKIKHISESTTIAVKEDRGDHYVTKPLNLHFNVNGDPMTFEKIKMGTLENTIVFHYHHKVDGLAFLVGNVAFSHINIPFSSIEKIGNDDFSLSIKPFNQLPKQFRLTIKQLSFYSHQHFSYTFNLSSYLNNVSKSHKKDVKHNINKKIATIKNTDIYLEQISYSHQYAAITLNYRKHDPNQPISLINYGANVLTTQHHQTLGNYPVISITNQNGDYIATGQGSLSDHSATYELNRKKALSAKSITITEKNMMYSLKGVWSQVVSFQ